MASCSELIFFFFHGKSHCSHNTTEILPFFSLNTAHGGDHKLNQMIDNKSVYGL